MSDVTIYIADERELRAKLEAGHRVEWCEEDPRNGKKLYFICVKRGKEYVTICGTSERQANANWKKAHDKGYYYDERTKRRVAIPGAR